MKNLLSIRHSILRNILLLLAFTAVCNNAWGEVATLTFTKKCNDKGTDDKGNAWTVSSDQGESTFDSEKGIHYGTGSAPVSFLTLTTNGIKGVITKVVVNASGASGTSAKLDVKVGGSAFGSQVSLTSSNKEYTFEGSASGEIEVKASQTSATIALYVLSIAVTYSTDGELSYTVTYDANGATSGTVPSDDTKYNHDATVTVLGNTGSLAKSGYTYIGWNTMADGTGTDYAAGATFTITENTTLFAKWIDNNLFHAVVSTYGGKNYAMGYTLSNNTLAAVEVNAVNGKVVNASNPDDISWALTKKGEVINKKGEYVSYNNAAISLGGSTTSTFTEIDDNGFYWLSGTRGFLYCESEEGFKAYAASNAGKSGYGTIGYLMDFADGYVRTGLTDGKMGTICMPCAVNANDFSGAKFYSIAGKRVDSEGNPTSIVFAEETALEAGMPYIFIADATGIIAAYSGEISAANNHNGLYGVLDGTYTVSNTDTDIYAVTKNTIKKCASGSTIGENRAYIKMGEVGLYSSSSKATFEISLESETDGIKDIELGAMDLEPKAIYNLNGQRISTPVKGQIYIMNGRKYLTK